MPAPKDPVKREEWIRKLSIASSAIYSTIRPKGGFPKKGTKEYEEWIHTPAYGEHCKASANRARGDNNPMAGTPPWNKGRTGVYTEKTLTKMSTPRLDWRGENNCNFGKHHSKETRDILSDSKIGENNPAWLGGISFDPYSKSFNRLYKQLICKNQVCQICGEPGGKLVPHHWDYNKMSLNCVPVHLICNIKANSYREWYQMAFNVKYGGQPFIPRVT
jgi:hypothetical protein